MPAPSIWLIDLDNTLHQADAAVFPLINRAMTAYLVDRLQLTPAVADSLRQAYWQRYGATLSGLIRHHSHLCPHEFLRQTHPMAQILPLLQAEPELHQALASLPGQRVIFSNGPQFYVDALLDALHIRDYFCAAYGIDRLKLQPKPHAAAYREICRLLGVSAWQCLMVDDSITNLITAKQLGMTTIHYSSRLAQTDAADYTATNMAQLAALAGIAKPKAAG